MIRRSKFSAGEHLSLAKDIYWVAGKWQYTLPDDSCITRYSIFNASNTEFLLEERGTVFSLLRPFPPAAQPEMLGSSVTVMGSKYSMSGVQKLSFLASEGQVAAGIAQVPLLMSSRFVGSSDQLLREFGQGTKTQQYYSIKPIRAEDLLTAEELERIAQAQQQAAQDDETDDSHEHSAPRRWFTRIGSVFLVFVLLGGLMSFCSSDDSEEGDRSARGISGVYHGK